jgi:hypothetical protein
LKPPAKARASAGQRSRTCEKSDIAPKKNSDTIGKRQWSRWGAATVRDWIKLAALSLLISIGITAVFATAAFAVWWEFMR